MADPSLYTYPSPLAPYAGLALPPLPNEISEDGKSYVNPPAEKASDSYEAFTSPLDRGRRGGFDIHIYYFQNNPFQLQFAKELWERIRREFPELRIYKFWEHPVGPHPVAMFEVNVFSPAQFGAFIPWLVINRGPLSVLVHPNTVEVVEEQEGGEKREVRDEERDHTQRAMWMGERVPLDLSLFKRLKAEKEEPKKE